MRAQGRRLLPLPHSAASAGGEPVEPQARHRQLASQSGELLRPTAGCNDASCALSLPASPRFPPKSPATLPAPALSAMQDAVELREGPSFALVTPAPLSTDALVAAVADDSAGAIATFTGVTRNSFQGKPTEKLEYEAYVPMAARKLLVGAGQGRLGRSGEAAGGRHARVLLLQLLPSLQLAEHAPLHCSQELCREACARWQLCKVAIAHRTGTVLVGEASVVIACSSAHRADALEASAGVLPAPERPARCALQLLRCCAQWLAHCLMAVAPRCASGPRSFPMPWLRSRALLSSCRPAIGPLTS